jgi:phage gpG-like protein
MEKIEFQLDSATLDKLSKFVEKEMYVKIGVLNNEKREDGFGAAELASVHEYGSVSRNIPRRSFLSKTMSNKQEEFEAEIKKNMKRLREIIKTNGPEDLLNKIGAKWVGYVLETFEAEGPGWTPLKPATIKRKGSSKILQDTATMKKSIMHEVVSE